MIFDPGKDKKMNAIPDGYERLNMNLPADVKAALADEARINARQTGPHVAKLLTDYVRRKQARKAKGETRRDV